jgi:transcriptional regulator with XRE-family HTH domain
MAYASSTETGLRLRHLRKIHKMTQADLAKKMKLSAGYISLIERGERCTLARYKQLSDFFNVSLDFLLAENLKYPQITALKNSRRP